MVLIIGKAHFGSDGHSSSNAGNSGSVEITFYFCWDQSGALASRKWRVVAVVVLAEATFAELVDIAVCMTASLESGTNATELPQAMRISCNRLNDWCRPSSGVGQSLNIC